MFEERDLGVAVRGPRSLSVRERGSEVAGVGRGTAAQTS